MPLLPHVLPAIAEIDALLRLTLNAAALEVVNGSGGGSGMVVDAVHLYGLVVWVEAAIDAPRALQQVHLHVLCEVEGQLHLHHRLSDLRRKQRVSLIVHDVQSIGRMLALELQHVAIH